MIVLVVLNYNDSKTVIKYIENIKNYKSIDKIVVVDNCSTDDSYEMLKELEEIDRINVIQTEANKGYSTGNNFGVEYAMRNWSPEYIIISNPDVEYEEKVIPKLARVIKDKAAAAATCKMICTSGIDMPVAWKLPSFRDCIFDNLIILKKITHYSNAYKEEDLIKDIEKVEVLPGSFFMIDSRKFIEAGGFDNNTFLYSEENILGKRFQEKNFSQYLIMEETFIHRHSVSINQTYKNVEQRLKLAYKSRRYYCEQYLKINRFQKILLDLTFRVGTFNYVFLKRLIKK